MSQLGVRTLPGVVRPEWTRVGDLLRFISRLFSPNSGSGTKQRREVGVPQPDDPDAELLVAVLAEHPHATRHFRVLMEKYWAGVWTMCQAILLNEQDAEDATQRTFLKVHRHLHGFRFESWFAGWIRQIARREALTLRSKRKREQKAIEEILMDPALGRMWHPREETTPRESPVLRELSRLDADDRLIVTMHELEGYSYSEIADVMDTTPGALRMRAMRARSEMRTALARAAEEEES